MAETIALVGALAGVAQAASNAKPVFYDPLMTKVNFSENIVDIHRYLEDAVQNLVSVKLDFKNEVEGNKMKKPSEAYLEWNSRVTKIEKEAEELIAKYKKHRIFLLSSFKVRMKKMHQRVINLRDEGNQIREKILVNRPPEIVVNMRAPDIKEFETLQKSLEKILDLMKGNTVKGIRIHGPLGIGKTTIMLNLNNHEQIVKMFDIVIWLKVSKEGSKENLTRECLQRDIVQRLQLKMGDTSNADEVAQKISMELKDKNYLLLLDDVKENLKLDEIGIPHNNNCSKIVLTTRLHHVCSSMVNRGIRVAYLSKDEAWKMFKDVLGNPKHVENPEIAPLAWRVCRECGGLPLLIEKVANTFKLKNDVYLWSEGLNGWRMWPEKECQGIHQMYKLLKFCYDDLDEDRQKKCFLYGALYPEDFDINKNSLLECWAAEDLLGNDCGTTNMRVMIAHRILNRLMNVSLLEEGSSENHVTMHKFMRQVALYIAEDDPECKYLVQTNRSLREAPDEKSWIEKNRISLGNNELVWLPKSPCCTMLSTLFLQENSDLTKIPELFFKHMENLRVLDLSGTGITLLPSSISKLTSLKNLYLNDCKDLVELPSDISELAQLEALDIRGSGVNNIPPHIEKLIHLRRLLVSFTKLRNGNATQEVAFAYNMISKLHRLEELVIDMKSPDQWSNEVVENIIKEVASLKELKILKFCISNEVVDFIKLVNMDLFIRFSEGTNLQSFMERSSWRNIQNIRNFQIFIGCQNSDPQIPGFVKYERYIKYCNGAGNNFPTLDFLARANGFELVNHKDIKHLSDFGIASMKKVRGCLVESCDAIETIVGTVDNAEPVLPNLEDLYVKNVPKFESICKGSMQLGILTKLTTLHLISCKTLVKIFPAGVIQQLHKLQYLKIEECQIIKEIIAESDMNGDLDVLPKLKELMLLDMQKLSSVCAIESLKWGSLEKFEIFNCPGLCKLPFNKDNAAKLKTFKAEQQWWDKFQWQDSEVKERLQKLFVLG